MASEIDYLSDQLRRSIEGNAWHGPAVLELLADVTEARSVRRLRESDHTIREIVLHITAWQEAALRALAGLSMPPLDQPWEGDWPNSDKAWPEVVADLKSVAKDLANAVGSMPETRLAERVPGRDHYDHRFLLNGVVGHNLYHAGQIALLRK